MKNRSYFVLLCLYALIVAACSSGFKRPEGISEKMARYEAKSDSLQETPVINFPTSFIQSKSRAPASISHDNVEKRSLSMTTLSNKGLYFSTLFSQYKELKKFSTAALPEMKYCPAFQNQFLTYNFNQIGASTSFKINFDYQAAIHSKDGERHPELYLQVDSTKGAITFSQWLINEKNAKVPEQIQILYTGLDQYVQKMKSEIDLLCESGQSQNYYIFENLTQGVTKEKDYKANTLVKTPLFYNMGLITSLKRKVEKKSNSNRMPASATFSDQVDLQNEVLNRLNATKYSQSIKELGN